MITPSFQRGDITLTRERVDAIITPVNLTGNWYGNVDLAIIKVAGTQYHNQLRQAHPDLKNLDTLTVGPCQRHLGRFRDVLFVVDDLVTSLSEVVYTALMAVNAEAYGAVAMSAMRTGKKMGKVETSLKETMFEMRKGFERFNSENPDAMFTISIVILQSEKFIRACARHFFIEYDEAQRR